MKSLKVSLVIILFLALLPVRAIAADWSLMRLATNGGWDSLPAIVAMERGFFADEGILVSPMIFTDGEALLNSLLSGSTDMATTSQRLLLIMAAAEFPVKVIAMNSWGTETELIVPDEDTATLSVACL